MKTKLIILSALLLFTMAFVPVDVEVGACMVYHDDLSGESVAFFVDCDPPEMAYKQPLQKLSPFFCTGVNDCFFGIKGSG